ncbi:MAG: lysophospholipid acyltransferase family protein [Spirochaetales bacterium]|nr:lysophospholipid acyltransferase family protein [Spirochaetales bacterium]
MRILKKIYHITFKIISFSLFGLGGALCTIFVIPILNLFIKEQVQREKITRRLCSKAFASFVGFMSFVRIIKVNKQNVSMLKEEQSCIICANHPSLLDVVFLFSLMPNADCIVKADVWKHPFLKRVLSTLYIPNSYDGETIIKLCKESLDKGNNLIIFPEGTRTPRGEQDPHFLRSPAQVALRTDNDIIAVHIGCPEVTGLGKHDKIWTTPEKLYVEYDIEVKGKLSAADYKEESIPVGARALTKDLKSVILL